MTTVSNTGAGVSAYEVIEFVQQHAQESAQLVRSEMKAAQDRSKLVQDIAELSDAMQAAKTSGDYSRLRDTIAKFTETHKETWGAGEKPMMEHYVNAEAWASGTMVKDYKQTAAYPDATTAAGSFHATFTTQGGIDKDKINATLDTWMNDMSAWKDKVSGDDKIAMMKLQEDADNLKNVYGMGSALTSKFNEIAANLVAAIGK